MSLVLAGFTVAVTADRRRDELAGLLERQGARVVLAPALRIVPLADDARLRLATRELLERPPDVVVANTAIGMRGWLEAADGWGLGDALRARLGGAYLVARGPKARGRPARGRADRGLVARVRELRRGARPPELKRRRPEAGRERKRPRRRRRAPLAGRRIAVQLHGEPQEEFCGALAAAGAEVVEVPVYRWAAPLDPTPLQRLVDLITNRLVDAVTFTSAPAVGVAAAGGRAGHRGGPRRAAGGRARRLRGPADRRAAASGTAYRCWPRRGPASVRWPRRWPRSCRGGPGRCGWPTAELVLRGHAAVVDGVLKPLPPAQMAILRALAVRRAGCCPGRSCWRRCPAGPTSTRSRWRWPGCGRRWARRRSSRPS